MAKNKMKKEKNKNTQGGKKTDDLGGCYFCSSQICLGHSQAWGEVEQCKHKQADNYYINTTTKDTREQKKENRRGIRLKKKKKRWPQENALPSCKDCTSDGCSKNSGGKAVSGGRKRRTK